MRLRRLDLLRYGCFTDKSFELPVNQFDFHIIFGSNEAGKSTALAAIEDLIFDMPRHSPYNFLHDYTSMRVGAILESEGSSLEFVRRKGSKHTLLDMNNLPIKGGEGRLKPFLAGVDRSFFERMFSLNHVRLEAGGREILEAKDEIGQMLFSAGAGIVGLKGRLNNMHNEADGLWAPRKAGHRKYYQARDKLDEAKRELREKTLPANKWQKLRLDYEKAEENYSNAKEKCEQAEAGRTKLNRIRRVYRYVSRKARLEEEIKTLKDVASLPEDARQKLDAANRQKSESSAQIEVLSKQLEEARRKLENLTYDKALVIQADDVKQLSERRIEIRKEKTDLPKRQAELNAAEIEMWRLAKELDWHEKNGVDKLIERIPKQVKIKELRSLLVRRREIYSGIERHSEDLKESQTDLDKIRKSLDGMGEEKDVSGLSAVIRAVREMGDITTRLRNAEQKHLEVQGYVNGLFASLHPELPSEKDVIDIKVPPRPSVQSLRDEIKNGERLFQENFKQIESIKQKLNSNRSAYEHAAREGNTVTAEELKNARSHRDTLWKLVRSKHIEEVTISDKHLCDYDKELDDLPASLEIAMRKADEVADSKFENAEVSGRLAEMSRNINEQEEKLDQLRELEESFRKEGQYLKNSWISLWNNAPFEPLDPDAMLEWMEAHNKLLEAIGRRDETRAALMFVCREEYEAKENIMNELKAFGIDKSTLEKKSLQMILSRASDLEDKCKKEAQERIQLKESLQNALDRVEKRQRRLRQVKKDQEEWKELIYTALSGVGLASDLSLEAVDAQIDLIDQMKVKEREINNLRYDRIEKIKRDIANYESMVKEVVKKVAEDISGTGADDAVLQIESRLQEAQRLRTLQEETREEIDKLTRKVSEAERKYQEVEASVKNLREVADVKTNEELREAIEKSDRLRRLNSELKETLQMLENEGDCFTVEDLERECADVDDIDQVTAKETAITKELAQLRESVIETSGTKSEAKRELDAVGGEDAASRAAAERQEALAEMREVAEHYVRLRTSTMLLQWAIDRYRREKQAPLLKSTGKIFRIITGGSFEGLGIDYDDKDRAQLIGLRSDGKTVGVDGMSTGTRDQLYLALRVASIEDYLDHANALPFIADDLFINFDDDRSSKGFQVLERLADKTQVLFFTHHKHLVDIALSTLGKSTHIVSLQDKKTSPLD